MTTAPTTLTLGRPDDWHVHFRDGAALAAVVPHTARTFGRAVVMPNLKPPVTTVAAAGEYRARILAALPASSRFSPLMTLYLTDNMRPAEIERAKTSGIVHAVKYYPAGATTNSDSGVTSLDRVYPVLAAMERLGVVLSLHGEVTDPAVDMFDRERVFVETLLTRIVRDFPGLKVVLEHVTTLEAAAFVRESTANVGATITPHHLLWSRNALFVGGIRPHFYCLPILKRETHRQGADRRGNLGQSALFPRHRLGAACQAHQGGRMRVRRLLLGACGTRAVRRSVRRCGGASSARGFRESFRRGFLRPAAQHGYGDTRARSVECSSRISVRRGVAGAAARGGSDSLAIADMTSSRRVALASTSRCA
jgi:dihydroorotase